MLFVKPKYWEDFVMMDHLKDTLHTEDCDLVILHEGNIRTIKGKGVRTLYNILNDQPECLYQSKLAVKAVGSTSARIMIEGGISEVYAEYLSVQAYDLLKDADIVVKFDKKLEHGKFLKLWERLGETKD